MTTKDAEGNNTAIVAPVVLAFEKNCMFQLLLYQKK